MCFFFVRLFANDLIEYPAVTPASNDVRTRSYRVYAADDFVRISRVYHLRIDINSYDHNNDDDQTRRARTVWNSKLLYVFTTVSLRISVGVPGNRPRFGRFSFRHSLISKTSGIIERGPG